jgi:hypothetical protein
MGVGVGVAVDAGLADGRGVGDTTLRAVVVAVAHALRLSTSSGAMIRSGSRIPGGVYVERFSDSI